MIKLKPLLEEQIRDISKPKPTLVFPESGDPRILAAASHLTTLTNVILIGRKEDARKKIEENQIPIKGSLKRYLSSVRFVMPEDVPDVRDALFEKFWHMSHGKRWAVPYEKAQELINQPTVFACMLVRMGYADAVLGGVSYTSRDFFRPALRLLHSDRTAFEVGLFSLPDDHPDNIYQQNLVAFADVAINPDPDAKELAHIAVGACKIVRDLIPTSVMPYVNGAIVSYSTKGSGEGPSVDRVRQATKLVPGMLEELTRDNPLYNSIRIEGELQISCAISIAAAQSKLKWALEDPTSPVGRANVIIVPTLDTGNILYHLYATRFPHSDRVLMIGGLNSRVLDFSRSSTIDDVVLGGLATVLRIKRASTWLHTPEDRFFRRFRLLVINPGSTSTKIAAYQGIRPLLEAEVRHPVDELASCRTIFDQRNLRMQVILDHVEKAGIELKSLDAVVGRGGLIRPVVSGTYAVNQTMLEDLRAARFGEHASNLGPALAASIAESMGIPALTVDPVVVDELDDVARVTGMAGVQRKATWHALSQKAVAKQYAEDNFLDYDELNVIVAHMGGGITVGCHRKGRATYVNHGLDEGPMTPERAGNMPHSALIQLCLHNDFDERTIRKMLCGHGGLVSHLSTSSLKDVERMIDEGDPKARLIFEALAQGIAAEIASRIPRFEGEDIDQVILTGGMSRSKRLVERLQQLLARTGLQFTIFPGELEMEALRDGAMRVLNGLEDLRNY